MQTQIESPQQQPGIVMPDAGNGEWRAEMVLGLPVVFPQSEGWNTRVAITPAQAKALLVGRWPQRPIRPSRVARFVQLIVADRFLLTHQGIAFNAKGELIDGQHRLAACVEAKQPITVQAFFNQPVHNFKALDRGAVRTLADDMVVMEQASPGVATVLQAAARVLFHFDAGRLPWLQTPFMDSDDIVELTARHPKLAATCEAVYRTRGAAKLLPPAPTAAFFALFREVDEERAMIFLEQLRWGADLEDKAPALTLRNALLHDESRRHLNARNSYMVRLVHAWNAFRSRRKVASLYAALRDGTFPEVSGYRPRKDAA